VFCSFQPFPSLAYTHKVTTIKSPSLELPQVSLRDPLRAGVDDLGLKEIIGAAVSLLSVCTFILFWGLFYSLKLVLLTYSCYFY